MASAVDKGTEALVLPLSGALSSLLKEMLEVAGQGSANRKAEFSSHPNL